METENKPMLSVDEDGNVLKCAKGMGADACGYKGGPICAKCGARPVEMKMVPVDLTETKVTTPKKEMMEDEEAMEDEEEAVAEEDTGEEEDMGDGDMEDEDMEEDSGPGESEMDEEDNMEEDDEEMPSGSMKSKKKGMNKPYKKMGMAPEDAEEEDMADDEYEDDEEEGMKTSMMRDMRKRRINSMGMKAADLGETGYICAIERKAHPGASAVCDDCPGGCIAEKGLPGLLEVEGIAETEFKGVVIDSGYSADADMFVVDVQVKDGSVREVFIDGTTAEIVGFHKLDDDILEKKSAIDEMMVIGFVDAAEIAVKAIDGTVVAVEPDVFEGIDSYAVEIDGVDGKSYDVFVGLDGEVLGYDKYEPEEAEEIEAEAAEIALKRAFSEDRRMSMAKEGMALPDGSYPIASEDDLKNAIQAFGRAKDKEATKRHIMKRARDMGKENLIPANWVAGGETKKKSDEESDADFMKSLIEFELLQADIENN